MILIETTGLADPAPVAQTFFADDFVQQKLTLDGIISVVDAKHIIQHLDEEKPEGVENESVEQIAFADRILLNKTDLVEPEYLVEVEKRIRMINEKVQIQRCQRSKVNMDFLLGIGAFDLDKILEMDDGFLDDDAEHQHDDRVSSAHSDIMSQKGMLKKFFEEKGFGFVTPDEGGEDVFVHVKDNPKLDGCIAGSMVTFDSEWDDRKGKYKGTNVVPTGGVGNPYGGFGGGGGGGGGGRSSGDDDAGYSSGGYAPGGRYGAAAGRAVDYGTASTPYGGGGKGSKNRW